MVEPETPGAATEGGCLCGAVRYRSDDDAFNATICHCNTCRRAAGAANVAWFSVPVDGLTWQGTMTEFASSPGVTRGFCDRCGTTLSYRSSSFENEIDITIASLDVAASTAPQDHTQVSGALPWDMICDGRPAFSFARTS